MPDLVAYARAAAVRNGYDPDRFERQIWTESGFDPKAHNAGSDASGVAQIVPRWHPGVDVWNPQASLDYAAQLMAGYVKTFGSYRRALAAYNWGSGHVGGYTDGGVTYAPWNGERDTLPAETRRYLDVILGPGWPEPGVPTVPVPSYNPDTAPERQIADWVCSIRATSWVLKSLGIPVDIGALQDEMSPKYVTPADGLLDGRGYGVAETIKAHLPPAWQSQVHVYETISWDQLTSLAGNGPIALGLHTAYHWINVAKPLGDGTLSSPNPAPNYPATGPIGDTLTQAEFSRYGPASAVFVNAVASTVPPEPPPPADPRDARISELEAQVAQLLNDLASERTKLGVLHAQYAPTLADVSKAIEALTPGG